jgi:hypothetical protein
MNPKMITRSIVGLPSTVLFALLFTRRAMSISELTIWTGRGDDEVRKAVQVLGPDGVELVAVSLRERGEKFVCLAQGAQEMLPGFAALPVVEAAMIPDSEKSESGFVDAERVQPVDEAQGPVFEPELPIFGAKNAPDSEKSESGTGSIMIDDESIKQNKSINHQSEPAKIVFPKLRVILDHLEMLFGENLSPDVIPANTPPELALAWAAKLWQDYKRPGSKLNNPLGVMVSRLKQAERRKLHLDQLPDEFLIAIGIRHERPKLATIEDLQESWQEEQQRIEAEEQEREMLLEEMGQGVAERWAQALAVLAGNLPRSSFETWCADTRAVGEQDGAMIVGCRNAFAVDWMTQKAGPLLDFAVRFVELNKFLDGVR